jgi:thioredoxin-like negative regulator of GroEL
MIRGIPTLLLFKNGELKETIVGLAGKDDLVRVIDKHVASGASSASSASGASRA